MISALALVAAQAAAGPAASARHLCAPAFAALPFRTAPVDPYPLQLSFLKQGKYKSVARAYYQTYVCKDTPLYSGIDPRVIDAGLKPAFASALATAANGDFQGALTRVRKITAALPTFSDARFLAGVFEWALGERTQARADWRATLTAPHLAEPPDSGLPATFYAAREMLEWSRDKS